MFYRNSQEVLDALKGVLEWNGLLRVLDENALRTWAIDRLALEAAVSPKEEVRNLARKLIRKASAQLGIRPSSILAFYQARGQGKIKGFTVPAINIRGLTYDVARAVFRAVRSEEVGAVVFEIARSEIGYTDQRPVEYNAMVQAAAIRERYLGPLFLQGDHFQIRPPAFNKDPGKEIQAVKDLIREAIAAGFYNIDIDTSTLVDLSRPTLLEQQRPNFELAAELTAVVRESEPQGVSVSVGGEIGEVGGKNSTVEELHAYMKGYQEKLAELGFAARGISKISVQTGTTHGGVPLPDGKVAQVKIDFSTLEKLSKVAREEYGMAGAVQHGASTLPEAAFGKFPEVETAEIHLATEFQNMIYEHPTFPESLRREIYAFLEKECAGERKPDQTREQFIYKTRKKALGPFKKQLCLLPQEVKGPIGEALEEKFVRLFKLLRVSSTSGLVKDWLSGVPTEGAGAR